MGTGRPKASSLAQISALQASFACHRRRNHCCVKNIATSMEYRPRTCQMGEPHNFPTAQILEWVAKACSKCLVQCHGNICPFLSSPRGCTRLCWVWLLMTAAVGTRPVTRQLTEVPPSIVTSAKPCKPQCSNDPRFFSCTPKRVFSAPGRSTRSV